MLKKLGSPWLPAPPERGGRANPIQPARHWTTLRAFQRARATLGPLEAHLKQLSPPKILERGYASVERAGKLVKSSSDAPVGSDLRVRLAQGELGAKVTRAS